MERNEEIKTIMGIALLYTMITSISLLLSRLTIFISQDHLEKTIDLFLQRYALWIIVVIGTIVILNVYSKKLNQKSYSNILENRVVRLTTGVLVSLDGLINLSSLLPLYTMNVKSSIQLSNETRVTIEAMVTKLLMSNLLSLVIILCQIFVGIYLVKYYKKKTK